MAKHVVASARAAAKLGRVKSAHATEKRSYLIRCSSSAERRAAMRAVEKVRSLTEALAVQRRSIQFTVCDRAVLASLLGNKRSVEKEAAAVVPAAAAAAAAVVPAAEATKAPKKTSKAKKGQ